MKKTSTTWSYVFSSVGQRHTMPHFRKAGYGGCIIISFLLVAFSACTSLLGGGAPEAATPVARRMVQTTPTPDPQQIARNRALQLVAGMSLDQKLGQLIVVEYLGNNYQNSGLQYMVTQQYVGGLLYQDVNHNFDAPDNTIDGLAAFSQRTQQDAKIPLLIGTDQEGGQVNRLEVFHGSLPSADSMAATGNPDYVFQQGKQAAKWMLQLGMNADMAPVVDIHTVNPPILQDRMFGSTPQAVETYAGAFLNGLQQNGVAGCIKHFPGLEHRSNNQAA